MNIYADRGNLLVLEQRCRWRGIGFQLTSSSLGETFDPLAHDLFYLGGGQDRDQRLCAEDLIETKRAGLLAAADRDAIVLGVCGGYQLLGHSYTLGEERIEGATAGARGSGRARTPWDAWSRDTATTGAAVPRAPGVATRLAPTCTGRCCRRTCGSRIG